MYLHPFLILKKRLQEIPNFKEIEWYLQQDHDQHPKFTSPGGYISFNPMPTQQLDRYTQMAEAEVNIYLVTDSVHDNQKRITKPGGGGITHAALADETYKKVHGFSAKISYLDEYLALAGTENDKRIFNSLQRTNITPPHSFSKKVVSIQTFSGLFYDHSNNKAFTDVIATLEIQQETISR